MKKIMHYSALFIITLCSTNILKSAQAKPTREKPDLKIAIPESYEKEGREYIQHFQSRLTRPLLNLILTAPRMGAPLPENPHTFNFEIKEPAKPTLLSRLQAMLQSQNPDHVSKKLRSRL